MDTKSPNYVKRLTRRDFAPRVPMSGGTLVLRASVGRADPLAEMGT